MDYSKAEATIKDIEEAITLCESLSGQLTQDILDTSAGSIDALREKIEQLKAVLEAAKGILEAVVAAMKAIEAEVKS